VTALVSILIPAYNAERLIADTLHSALAQTWRHKEIIVVDDGSKDRSFEVAKAFASRRVKVVRQANTGAPGARNAAYAMAQGDYIQWLDADDLLHPRKLEHQMAAARDAGERTLLTASWGKFFFSTERARFRPDALWQERLAPADWIRTRFEHNAWMNPAVWLVSRRLSEAAGPWDTRLGSSGDDDGEYICRVAAASDGVRFVRDATCYYRIGTVGSLNWNMETSDKPLESLLLSLQLSVQHLLALEDSERARAAALRHLETFSAYFYGAPAHFHERLSALAAQLGGTVRRPGVGWKYALVEKALGPQATRMLMRNWRASKLRTWRRLDLCLYRLGI
jgi:glycosyltransferase involved in cell wall biosynthesis